MKAAAAFPARDPGERQLRLERLLGRRVLTAGNRSIGRIEEFRAERDGRDLVIKEYVIGAAGLVERLGVAMKLLVGKRGGGYVACWDQIDISDPERPRLTCPVDDLRNA